MPKKILRVALEVCGHNRKPDTCFYCLMDILDPGSTEKARTYGVSVVIQELLNRIDRLSSRIEDLEDRHT